jgi:hypothetical protein
MRLAPLHATHVRDVLSRTFLAALKFVARTIDIFCPLSPHARCSLGALPLQTEAIPLTNRLGGSFALLSSTHTLSAPPVSMYQPKHSAYKVFFSHFHHVPKYLFREFLFFIDIGRLFY